MFRLFTILLITVTFCTSLFAAVPAADQIFPDTTKGFVTIRNIVDFSEQWKETQFGKLTADPLMKDFKEEVQKQLTARLEKSFGLTFDGVTSLPSGEVAFGMISTPDQTPGYIFMMDITGKRSETDKYFEDLTAKFIAAKVKMSAETYREQQVTILTFPPPEQPAAAPGVKADALPVPVERQAQYMIFQDVLLVSDQLHLIKLIADRLSEPAGKALADVEAYQVVMKRCLDDMPADVKPAVCWYIEPLEYGESVRTLLRGPVAQNRREKPSIFSILKQQGFDAIQGIGGVVTVKTEEYESVYRTFIYTKKPYRLAMQMFNFPDDTNFSPPIWMPSDLARCTMVYVDPIAIFDNVGGAFDAVMEDVGMWKNILKGLEEDPYGPKINIREELIVHLGNRVLGMSRYGKPITVKSESIVIAVELKEGKETAMRAGLEKLFGKDQEMDFVRYKSYKIWHRKQKDVLVPTDDDIDIFDFDDPPGLVDTVPAARQPKAAQGEDPPPTFPDGGIVAATGCLLVSTNRDYLKVILDRLDSPEESAQSTITDEEEYKAVNKIFGSLGLTDKPHFFQFFARTQETMRPTYEMIRKNQMAHSQAILAKLMNELLSADEESGVRRQVLDGSTMPEFDKVQHYFGNVGIYGASEENGYYIKGFAMEK